MLKTKLKKSTPKKRVYKKRKPIKKEFILPLYFGWEIAVRRVNDLRKHIVGPFKKYWQFMAVVVLLIALVSSSMLLKNYESVKAATYYFVQTSWSGGLDGGVFPDHTDNKTNWNKYSAVDDNLATSTNLSLTATSNSITETSDADFNEGDKTDHIYVESGTVYPEKPNSYACEGNDDNICQSGRCDTTCQAKLADGQACDENSDCVNSCNGSVCYTPWITGYCGVEVYYQDISGTKQWKTTQSNCDTPQCGQDGGQDNDNLVADNTVDFAAYPARNACKAIGGRLPTKTELNCIYLDKVNLGNNFVADYYWSSTEYNTNYAWYQVFYNGNQHADANKTTGISVRCVRDW